MGGGGGSSTYSDQVGVMASAGGDGGGIVFIIADSVNGNNKSILASGNSALNATGISSGAGGGGAGGSIVIFSENYSSGILNIQANGGKGGDVFHSFQSNPIEGGGEGGGGGGGYVALLKESPLPSNININYTGGPESFVIDIDDPASVDGKGNIGDDGLMRAGVDPVLTGFLFNSIRSSVTGNQIDSVCSNMIPPKILGTTPMGGSGPYAYLWEKSYDQVAWTPLSNDADPVNYTPAVTESANSMVQENSDFRGSD